MMPIVIALRCLSVIACLACTASLCKAQAFGSPIHCEDCISDFFYFDQGDLVDWNCRDSTYDGHRGSDFSLRHGNRAIDTGEPILAMADGIVAHAEDGHFDGCNACDAAGCGYDFGNGFGNHVIIDHGTYSVHYGHMRMGSVRFKEGDKVRCGQRIGQFGSSGCSTGAHLHVEPRPLHGGWKTAFDPFRGSCSESLESLWSEQPNYRRAPQGACKTSAGAVCPADAPGQWTCSADGTEVRRCSAGEDVTEPCPNGCDPGARTALRSCRLPADSDDDGMRSDVDCDDSDASVHPGAQEVCGDGKDQDCDGLDRPCVGEVAFAPCPQDDGDGSAMPCNQAARDLLGMPQAGAPGNWRAAGGSLPGNRPSTDTSRSQLQFAKAASGQTDGEAKRATCTIAKGPGLLSAWPLMLSLALLWRRRGRAVAAKFERESISFPG